MSALYVGLAHGALGQLEEAEAALRTGLEHYERIFSREDRDSVTALGRVAHAMAARGRFEEARRLLDDRREHVEARPGPDTPLAMRTLLARQVELALLHGDLNGAGALIEPMREVHSRASDLRARGPSVINEARWHLLAGRAQPAARVLATWLEQLPPGRAAEPATLRARVLQGEVELALEHNAKARATLQQALFDLRRIGATRNWNYRRALELHAVAHAVDESTDVSKRANAAWSGLERAESEAGITGIEAPSIVEHAESLRRRAHLLRLAGRTAEAATLESSLRAALVGQHAASPRRAWLVPDRL
jgi:tetratricopeptide (TPR) repeat protein